MGNEDDGGSVSSVTFEGVADTVEGGKALLAGLVALDEATAGGRVHELRTAVMKLQDELAQALETERTRNKKLSVGVCQAICGVLILCPTASASWLGATAITGARWRSSPPSGEARPWRGLR
ncbi:hypothetical protein LSTR_LSTR014884 [Laodelphax striatellus]|uniref:Uncharacterized protein n=1 Tax=Laodelphax striatellus TaxID=195883 RepID=A0A482X6I5_LAOST|nr:hypothetical protein LSTR_LSTR014884 [Laodelphax striatellus]